MFQDDGNTTVLIQTQQEAEKLKAEQMRIEEEVCVYIFKIFQYIMFDT